MIMCFILMISCAEEGDVSLSSLNQWVNYKIENGLASNRVLTLFEDRNNNIWIGTDKGLNFYNGITFTKFTLSDGLVSKNIQALAQDDDGDIWVGTSNGINILIDEEWFYFPLFDGVTITSLLKLISGDILIGTEEFGVIIYRFSQNDFFEYYFSGSCASCNMINALYQEKNGTIWLGTEGGLKRVIGASVTSYTVTQGLPDNQVRSITQDNWGNIWIGTFEGSMVSRYKDGSFENISLANALTQSWVWDLEIDDIGTLWISTVVGGLYRYDGAVMRKDFDNLPDENVSALLKHSNGDIWIGTLFSGLIKHTP